MNTSDVEIVLVGNYVHDGHISMDHFTRVLREGLTRKGWKIRVLRPASIFGRLCPGSEGVGKYLGYLDKFLLFPLVLLSARRRGRMFHIVDQAGALYLPLLRGSPHLQTCNDLLAVRASLGEFEQVRVGRLGRFLQRAILFGLSTAKRVTCISEATRQSVLRLTDHSTDAVCVTYMGFNYDFDSMDPERARAVLPRQLEAPYLLHVGGNQWYKNRVAIVECFEHLCERGGQHELVLAGKAPDAALKERIASSSWRERIRVVVAPSNDVLNALYQQAELLLFPSLHEGYGWPVIEAMAVRTLVVTSDRAPMTEVGGDAAVYGDPERPELLALAVEQVLGMSEEEKRLRVDRGLNNIKRFSTEGMIDRYDELYRSVLSA